MLARSVSSTVSCLFVQPASQPAITRTYHFCLLIPHKLYCLQTDALVCVFQLRAAQTNLAHKHTSQYDGLLHLILSFEFIFFIYLSFNEKSVTRV